MDNRLTKQHQLELRETRIASPVGCWGSSRHVEQMLTETQTIGSKCVGCRSDTADLVDDRTSARSMYEEKVLMTRCKQLEVVRMTMD